MAVQHPSTGKLIGQDIPLPGTYPCITLQYNVTVYPASKQVKWVASLREPISQVELNRFHGLTYDPLEARRAISTALMDLVGQMYYMAWGQAPEEDTPPPPKASRSRKAS